MRCPNYWKDAGNGAVICELCPRHCTIREGGRGFCFVRKNSGGVLHLDSYGRAAAIALDPVEKKPLYHFFPGTSILSMGSIGCNLSCSFCQNWDLSRARSAERLDIELSADAFVRAAVSSEAPSVAFTYNEPIVSFEFIVELALACRAAGKKTVAVTAGYIEADPRKEFFSAMDAANVDLKSFSEAFYERYCGVELAKVLETVRFIAKETETWLELTTLVIPGLNDGADEIRRMSAWIVETCGANVPLHLSAFHPAGRMMERKRTSFETLAACAEIASSEGIAHVYIGNVSDERSNSTWCVDCGEIIVRRMGYRVENYMEAGGRCRACGRQCPGVFA